MITGLLTGFLVVALLSGVQLFYYTRPNHSCVNGCPNQHYYLIRGMKQMFWGSLGMLALLGLLEGVRWLNSLP